MRVARTLSFEETVVEEVPEPSLEPGDALVRVEACGLCGSDATRWYVNGKAPTVLGHEPAGVVVKRGEGCQLELGQRVFFHHHVSCGECRHCLRGLETNCKLFRSSKLDPGGFAEWVRVPKENVERDTLLLPDSVSFEHATFIEPLACSLRAIRKLELQAGDSVLVIGLGAMGLMNAAAAKVLGAGKVFASELDPGRRNPDPAFGVDAVLDPGDPEFAARLRELSGGLGPDHVIVGPSAEVAVRQALEVVAPGGSVCLFSPIPPDKTLSLSLNRLYFGEVRLVASYSCAAKETREALEWIQAGRLPIDPLISHRLTLDQVGAGILRTAAAGPNWLRALVLPFSSSGDSL